MKNKSIKIPAALAIAIAQYYFGRQKKWWTGYVSRSYGDTEKMTFERSTTPWNKEAALDNIARALPKGWSYL